MAHLIEPGTPWVGRLGRRLIFGLDDQLRRCEGIYAFSQDPDCLLRIARGASQKERILADGTILHAGDAVIELHWWNERIAHLAATGHPLAGPSLHWGLQFYRHTYHSLLALAQYVDQTPGLRDVVALHGETTFSSDLSYRHHAHAFQRLGFELETLPPADDAWELMTLCFRHFHVWALTWACNPASLRRRSPWAAVRSEMWLSRQALFERCIGAGTPALSANGRNSHYAGASDGTGGGGDGGTGRVRTSRLPVSPSPRLPLPPSPPDAWKLLRASMRSHYSSWRRCQGSGLQVFGASGVQADNDGPDLHFAGPEHLNT